MAEDSNVDLSIPMLPDMELTAITVAESLGVFIGLDTNKIDEVKMAVREIVREGGRFEVVSEFEPAGDQPAAIEEITGVRPVGYRAPSWNHSPNTLRIVRDIGFLYESSLMHDDRPYELVQDGEATGLVELPVEWILDDAPLMNPRGDRYTPPRELLQVYIDEFDKAYEEGTMFLLTTHPHIIGHRSRIIILEELIDYIQTKENVWFANHQQIAEYVKEQAGME